MPQRAVIAMFLLSLATVGCDANTSSTDQNRAGPSPALNASPEATGKAPDALPAPKTKVSLQQKSIKAFSIANSSKTSYQVVDQWVFQPDDTDGSLICVGDGEHCITLQKLREQLNRPANDPMGIR
jgi:hypothetical protein